MCLAVGAAVMRAHARRGRRYARWTVLGYRSEQAPAAQLQDLLEVAHRVVQRRWWRRLRHGQPSLALELHLLPDSDGRHRAAVAATCERGMEGQLLAALRVAYPNARLQPFPVALGRTPCVLRLKKWTSFIQRTRVHEDEGIPHLTDRLLLAMAAT